MSTAVVRVRRNPLRDHKMSWFVYCDVCNPSIGFFSFKPLGWAPAWQVAQTFADTHARRHEAEACDRCGHMSPLENPMGARA